MMIAAQTFCAIRCDARLHAPKPMKASTTATAVPHTNAAVSA